MKKLLALSLAAIMVLSMVCAAAADDGVVLKVVAWDVNTTSYYAAQKEAFEAANPGINATIKDKYFNSVAATPAHILPILDSLCQKHLRKLDTGKRIYFDKQIGELKCIMGEENPVRLSLPEQGSFYLGYYHQKQKRYEKKENN